MFLDRDDENYISALKTMSYRDMGLFAVELREFIIDSVAKTGGHLASNLGVVELTLALHKVFDTPKDKIIFDVGHQSYVHKILTGRKSCFGSLRKYGGLSGFPKRSESVHDAFDSGHSSTSISAALGFAKARDLKKEKYCCVAVIGDGALTGGVAFEALNAAGSSKTPLIVVLNDNQMSIDGSTGGMAEHLHKLRISSSYLKFKDELKEKLEGMPGIYNTMKNLRDLIKHAVIPTGIFEELGFKYFGPLDGHDIKDLCETLSMARSLNRPVLVHVVTKKGKGFVPAEKNPSKYHGVGSFAINSATSKSGGDKDSYSEIFGQKLLSLAKQDKRIVAVSAAMTGATGLSHMQAEFPERTFDVCIAEQHAASFSAGLALNGMRPVVAIYSTFLQRAYDQIVTEVALQKLPVVFAIDRAGISGKDGETHQGMFDISYMSSIPNMTVLAPKDGGELEAMLEYALSLDSPVAIRYPRDKNSDLSEFSAGMAGNNISNAELLGEDGEFAILALGSMVKESLLAADILRSKGIRAAVYNIRRVKPTQTEFLDSIRQKYSRVVTVEDGCLNGGLGQQTAQYMSGSELCPKIACLALPDKFIEHGSIEELRRYYGLDAEGIALYCEDFFEKQA